jgi:hypothetical protein
MDGVIDEMPVMGRQAGHLRQLVEIELIVQVIMDIGRHPAEPLLIVGPAAIVLHSLPLHPVVGRRPSIARIDKSCGVGIAKTCNRNTLGARRWKGQSTLNQDLA